MQTDTFLAKFDGSGVQGFIQGVRGHAGEITIEIQGDNLIEVMQTLKEQFGYQYLADIATLDHYTDEGRFEVAYNLVNMADRTRLRVSLRVEEENPTLPTLTHLWKGAGWMEREAFDMMGIRFEGNEDLRRIYMPEDFEYYPMRKEFPQLGIPGSIELPEKDPPKPYK
ncbi:MAG: NADH-quinone oxidoreductase subunit C [Bacteroidota bacterium]